jgi:DNA-binding response OmpR family regulator
MKDCSDILVVEDDAGINAMIGEYLQLEGKHYRPALDGGSAIREARTKAPDLVILDLMLPDMDGFEVCRQLKNERSTDQVPIIILSALSDDESRQRGMACGAIDYLAKPFDPDRLLEAVTQHCRI